jgi:hypothetical protein
MPAGRTQHIEEALADFCIEEAQGLLKDGVAKVVEAELQVASTVDMIAMRRRRITTAKDCYSPRE